MSSSRIALVRRALNRRKLLLEPLEQRLLLTLAPADIDSDQQQVLEDGPGLALTLKKR